MTPEATSNIWRLSKVEERDVLDFDPWGDRDATYRVLRAGFCSVRQPADCSICFGAIAPGDRVWFRAETDFGKMKTFRFCPECCWCIAHRYGDDEGVVLDPWERLYYRWELGRKRAESRDVATSSATNPCLNDHCNL